MTWLNYHHLLYFWTVAREGSIARACALLLLTQPTISGQLRALDKALGVKVFDRVGRRLVLTETGRARMEPRLPARFETVMGVAATTNGNASGSSSRPAFQKKSIGTSVRPTRSWM